MKGSLDIILSVLPVISLFVLGNILRRIHFFQDKTVQEMKKLVVSVALPCLLFQAFSQLDLQLSLLLVVITVFLTCVVMLLIGKAAAGVLHIKTPYFPLMFGGFETGMLGYAIFIAVYGVQEIDKLALIDLGQVLFVFFVLMALLIKLRDGTQHAGQLLRMFLTSPVIIAILAGLIVSLLLRAWDFSDTRGYGYVIALTTLLGNLTVPLICLSIGYELHLDFQTLRLSLQTILLRKILLVMLAVLINKVLFVSILHLAPIYEYALLTMFVLPPPFVIAVFMQEGQTDDHHYVTGTLSLSTVISLLVFLLVSVVYR